MIKKLSLVILCLLTANVLLEEAEPVDENVVVLTDDNFDEYVNENNNILVKFYAPWCGHCKKMAPEFSAAAAVLKEDGIILAKLDATVHSTTAGKFAIQGYPTLKVFLKGKQIEYNGGRNKNDIITWMRKKTGPVSKELSGPEAVEEFKKSAEVVVVHFGNEGFDQYSDYAKSFDDIVFGHCVVDGCASHFETENGATVLFKNFDNKRDDLAKGYTSEEFSEFVKSKSTPLVMSFDEKSAQLVFGNNTPGIFLYYDKNSENASALEAIFNEVAVEVKGKIQAIKTGITEGLETRLAEYIGVTAADLPTVRITDTRVDMKKYNFSGEITAENIKQFVNDWLDGKLKQSLKSEEIPAEQTEDVYVLVGKSFDSVVLDETKDVLVKFYAPWCGHCKKLAPIYDELAKKLKDNKNIIIAKMDSTLNETDKVSIQGFPTIKFFPAKNKTPIDFNGDRTVEGFEKFLSENGSFPISTVAKDDL